MHLLRSQASVVAVCLLCVGCSFAATNDPILLRFHQKQGDTALYSLIGVVQTRVGTSPTDPATTQTTQLQCRVDYSKAIGMGRMQVTGRVLGGTVGTDDAASDGSPATESETQYLVTALGEIRNRELPAGESVLLPLSFIDLGPADAFAPAPLPGEPVRVGDDWSGTQEIHIPDGAPAKIVFASKLVESTAYAGRRCLRLRTESHGSVEADLMISGLSNRVPAKLTFTATTSWLFDPAEGISVKADTKGTQIATVSVEDVLSVTVVSTFEQHAQLVEWNGQKLLPEVAAPAVAPAPARREMPVPAERVRPRARWGEARTAQASRRTDGGVAARRDAETVGRIRQVA